MIAVYIFSLFSAAGLTGLFVRQALGEQGYVPGFTAGLMLAGGTAAAFAGFQLLYVALVRSAWPTRTNAPLLFECLSHGAALLFIPYLLRMDVPWPHPVLKTVEGLVFAGLFLLVHGLLKLFAFYAILRSAPGTRAWSIIWAAVSVVCLLGGYTMFTIWLGSIERARPRAPEALNDFRIGTTYVRARAMPEGSVLAVDVSAPLGHCLTFGCAIPPDAPEEEPLELAYLTVEMRGETTTKFTGSVELQASGWSHLRVPADQLPRKLGSCSVRWSSEKETKWRSAVGVLPILSSDRTLLISGPVAHETRTAETTPNIVMIVIDGLGADRVASMGYTRATTPNIDRISQSAQVFPFTYTPAPEPAAACMTLLTGLSPLRHGYLGTQRGPLPAEYTSIAEAVRTQKYASAAFTEGEHWGDLTYGSGFERGFDAFDDGYMAETPPIIDVPIAGATAASQSLPPAGSQLTLQKARAWIEAHADVKFMVFVRLGELQDAQVRERHGNVFIPDPATATPSTVYDSIIHYLDRNIGDTLNALPPGKRTCVVITSTRGAFVQGTDPLMDWNLRVPLVFLAPGTQPSKRKELTALEDVPATLAKIAGVSLSPYASTADILGVGVSREPISLSGNPLMMTIRDNRMRLVWSTQRTPFTMVSTGLPAGPALYDLNHVRPGRPMQDISDRNPETVRRWMEKLEQYLAMQSEGWQRTPAP
ncbi:MAG: sulfatase-like hydrolase/transferase [Candidatus Hydrogenedentes bacterium]|nr:sulfatase-like hydrolase/transferase [Candidatus Hydrogenedentota bacterium]